MKGTQKKTFDNSYCLCKFLTLSDQNQYLKLHPGPICVLSVEQKKLNISSFILTSVLCCSR